MKIKRIFRICVVLIEVLILMTMCVKLFGWNDFETITTVFLCLIATKLWSDDE